LTTGLCTLQEINGLSLEGDEPSAAVAEEEAAPPAGATLPEASVVEGEYSAEVEVPS
jgi:hypothetical protein